MLAPEQSRDEFDVFFMFLNLKQQSPAAKTQEYTVCVTFDVSVDDHVAVQVRDPLQDLPGVAARHVFRQRSVRLQLVLNGALRAKKVRREPNLSHTSEWKQMLAATSSSDVCFYSFKRKLCPSVSETWLLDTFHTF